MSKIAVISLGSVLVLAACGVSETAGNTPAAGEELPAPSPVESASAAADTSANEVTQELSRYRLSAAVGYTPEQFATIGEAVNLLEERCMSSAGVEYTAGPVDLDLELSEQERLLNQTTFVERSEVERSGYDSMASQSLDYDVLVGDDVYDPEAAGFDEAFAACRDSAAEAINPGADAVLTHFPADIDEAQRSISLQLREETYDELVVWTTCMIENGYGSAETLPSFDVPPTDLGRSVEIEWAVGDFDCREKSGITDKRLEIRETAVADYVTTNSIELEKLAELRLAETARAQAILDGN